MHKYTQRIPHGCRLLAVKGQSRNRCCKISSPKAYRLHNCSPQETLSFFAVNSLYSGDPSEVIKRRLSSCSDYMISTAKRKLCEFAAFLSNVHKLSVRRIYLSSNYKPKYQGSEQAAMHLDVSAKTETVEKPQLTKASGRGPAENQTDRLASGR